MHSKKSDPKGLIRESYRIEGITPAECRSIFLDWAMSLPEGVAPDQALGELLSVYGARQDHPMTQVLQDGVRGGAAPVRRGGRSGRVAERKTPTT